MLTYGHTQLLIMLFKVGRGANFPGLEFVQRRYFGCANGIAGLWCVKGHITGADFKI